LVAHLAYPIHNKSIGFHGSRQKQKGSDSALTPVKAGLQRDTGLAQHLKPGSAAVDFCKNESRASAPLLRKTKHLLGCMQPKAHAHG